MIALWVAIGGAFGALARYGLGGWVQARAGGEFPWGTLVVNAVGSLALGFVLRVSESVVIAPGMRAFVAIGILGAFTTFSTFSYETVALLQDGEWTRAGAYALGSLLIGLAAVLIGFQAADLAFHARG